MIQRIKHIVTVLALLLATTSLWAQETNLMEVDYASTPRTLTIADIKVTGSETYEDYVLISFSGLSVGKTIKVPGNDISNAVNRFWKQGFFSDVKIYADSIARDSIWLTIALQQRPRISKINYYGMRQGEREDVEPQAGLSVGAQVTPDLIDRSKILIKKHFAEKGYLNTDVLIYQKKDPANPGSVTLDISVDKKTKVKVNEMFIIGNEALSVNKIDRAMKKTNRAVIWNFFRTKKFVKSSYEADKKAVIAKYNEIGYRDAIMLRDSVAKVDDEHVNLYMWIDEGKKYYFGDITWSGNTLYSSELLNRYLSIKKGDTYNLKHLEKRLDQDEDAVGALYRDRGYLFFNVEPIEVGFNGDTINFEMRMYEGQPATINKVEIKGNDRVYEHVVRRELRTRPGQLYSQSDIIRSLRDLAQLQYFNEEKLYNGIDVQPNVEDGTVDLTYNLESKSSDQFEFSAGWGQSGPVVSVGVKFTNFAIQNLFKPKMYRIVPQGEGQTFALKVQTNGKYYQNYSLSFYEPWLGGKRPNSFSMGVYYSVQTGYSQRYINAMNNNYYNSYNYYYNQYGGNYGYNNNYMTPEYDSNKHVRVFGANMGFGTRLNWPDDYFTFYAELSYQHFNLKNWYSYYYGFSDGIANNLSLSLTLGRNSIDNPIYTRRGSAFSFSVSATPPYSAWDKVDYSTATDAQKYKWIEYHKWKIGGKVFTPLTRDEKLVLMARLEYGFLGSYNKNKQSPFEKFYVGGDGMSGYTSVGSEQIGLRGYASSSLTPLNEKGNYNGNLYTRATVELRYPIMMQGSTCIWALAFLEAGNCWANFKEFNPFDLKRSAGVGVRVYLPMFGLLGVDWGYGFDAIHGSRENSKSQFTFVLGQEF